MSPVRLVRLKQWVSRLTLMLLVLGATLVGSALPIQEPLPIRQGTIGENYDARLNSERYRSDYSRPIGDEELESEMARIDGSRRVPTSGRTSRSTGGSFGGGFTGGVARRSTPTLTTRGVSRTPIGGNFGGAVAPAPAAAPAPATRIPSPVIRPPQPLGPAQRSAPAAPEPSTGSGYGGGMLSASSTGVIAEQAPPPPISLDEYASGGYAGQDSAYTAETAAAEAELQNLLDSLARQNAEYEGGFKDNLRTLGWKPQGDDWTQGAWDPTDTLGAYGQTYNNLQNDYAGRGLMDSTFYGNAQRDMTDRFNRQRTDLVDDRAAKQSEFAAGRTQATQAKEMAKQRALAEAYARYVSGFSI